MYIVHTPYNKYIIYIIFKRGEGKGWKDTTTTPTKYFYYYFDMERLLKKFNNDSRSSFKIVVTY